MEPLVLKKIDKYEVLHLIGRGGMGVVYKAADPSLDRVVAIKMVTSGDDPDGALLNRFHREAQFTANLHHPNIVTVYDKGEFEGKPYLVMEYLAGQSLDFIIARQPLSMSQRIGYVKQASLGLHYAHSRQPSIIHRDIKPANLVVLEDGTLKIVDFGIAYLGHSHHTRSGQLMGSYHYMSPEQISKKELDGRSDIFSLGIVLYQLLTLTHPFEGGGIANTLHRIVHQPPSPLGDFLREYPPQLDSIVARALAKDRHDRYQFANELAFDLQEVEDELNRRLFGVQIQQAETLIGEADFESARQQLAKVLDLDRQHGRANELMSDVQQALAVQQKKVRARELRARAEDALSSNRRVEALSCLDQAVKLDETNTDLRSFRDQVLETHARAEKLDAIFARAQRAFAVDDLDGANRAVEQVLELEPHSERAQAFRAIIAAKVAGTQKEQQLQQLLNSARLHIRQQDFSAALEIVGEAELLSPGAPGVRTLFDIAEAGVRLAEDARQKQNLSTSVKPEPTTGLQFPALISSTSHVQNTQQLPGPAQVQPRESRVQGQSIAQLTPAEGIPGPSFSAEALTQERTGVEFDREEMMPSAASTSARNVQQVEPSASVLGSSVAGGETGVAEPPTRSALPEELLQRAQRKLTEFSGPLAAVMVRRAAARNLTAAEFCRLLSENIESASDRRAFLSAMGQTPDKLERAPNQVPVLNPTPAAAKIGVKLDLAELERLTRILARFVGPLAGVLVKRAAQRASDANDLHKILAQHVETEPERTHFLREARFPKLF